MTIARAVAILAVVILVGCGTAPAVDTPPSPDADSAELVVFMAVAGIT